MMTHMRVKKHLTVNNNTDLPVAEVEVHPPLANYSGCNIAKKLNIQANEILPFGVILRETI